MAEESVESVQTTESETTENTESTESVLTAEATPTEETSAVESVLTSEPTEEPSAVVPDKYELKLPEGAKLEQAHIDEIAAFAKERGLSNEQAQALVDRDNARAQESDKQWHAGVQKYYAEVTKDAMNDPDLGGDHWKETVHKAQRVVDAHGDAELKQLLQKSPDISNHRAVLRFLRGIYEKHMAEGDLVTGDNSHSKPKPKLHEVFYGQEES